MQHQLVLALQLSDLFFEQRPVMGKLIRYPEASGCNSGG